MLNIKDLKFFDKNGYNYNFTYDDTNQMWTGVVLMKKCSVGLYSNEDIFIMESLGDGRVVAPFSTKGNEKISVEWDPLNTFVDEIFLFDYDSNYVKSETSALYYTYQDGVDLKPLDSQEYKLNVVSDPTDLGSYTLQNLENKCMQVHVGFTSTPKFDESTYKRTLYGVYNDSIIFGITFIAESVDEDERLATLCQNLGYNISNSDSKIFKDYPLDEIYPDYQLLNQKRKEILLEGHNIYPYVGSYKALVNAIKYFGYDNVGIAEYWKNINTGKLYKTDKYSISKKEVIRVDGNTISLPNSNYKKTNRVSLIYDINRITDAVDEMGLPITEEYFSYTIEEAINKLYLLRKKLDKEFMPGSSHLSDVIGEGNYFGLHRIESAPQYDTCVHINNGVTPTFDISANNIFITKNTPFTTFLVDQINASDSEFIYGEDYYIVNDDNIEFTNRGFVKGWKLYLGGDTIDIRSMKFEYGTSSDSSLPFYSDSIESSTSDLPLSDKSCAKFICHCSNFDNIVIDDVLGIEIDSPDMDLDHYQFGNTKAIQWIFNHYNNSGSLDETFTTGAQDIKDYVDYFVRLDKVGKWVIKCILYDAYNNASSTSKTINVTPLNIELLGFYNDARPLDIQYTEEEQRKFSAFRDHLLLMAYIQRRINKETDPNLQVADFYSSTTDSDSDNGPYKWSNLEYLRWYNSDHLTLEVTNHIQNDDTLRYIHNGVCVKPYTWVCIGTDFTRIADIDISSITWTLTMTDTHGKSKVVASDIKYPTFTYLLKEEGSYQLTCTLTDVNSNIYTTSRNIFTVSKTATYDSYIDFTKDNRYFR